MIKLIIQDNPFNAVLHMIESKVEVKVRVCISINANNSQ